MHIIVDNSYDQDEGLSVTETIEAIRREQEYPNNIAAEVKHLIAADIAKARADYEEHICESCGCDVRKYAYSVTRYPGKVKLCLDCYGQRE